MLITVILVFAGGAFGAVLREAFMLGVPKLSDGFPLDIFLANVLASFLIGVVAALHARGKLGTHANLLLATGVMGGLSTFSSFVYGALTEGSRSPAGLGVATAYLLLSLAAGYGAVLAGNRVGAR